MGPSLDLWPRHLETWIRPQRQGRDDRRTEEARSETPPSREKRVLSRPEADQAA
jgi:hypothetical protein